MSDTESEVGEMENELSRWASFTRPISALILWILNQMEGKGPYFEEGTTQRDDQQREKISLYFHAGFFHRLKLYFPIVLIISAVAILDRCGGMVLSLQGYGLIMDGFGAIVLAVGLFRGVDGIIVDTPKVERGAAYGGSTIYEPKQLSSTVRKTVDGILGGTFLFIGFSVQLYAVSGLPYSICQPIYWF